MGEHCRNRDVFSHLCGGKPNPMHSFRRFAFLLALGLPAMPVMMAQSSSSSSSSPAQDQAQTPAPAGEMAGQASVQARIRQRREQRRAAAIHDTYSHRWEAFMGTGYLRFVPGPSKQRLTFYSWDIGLTRFSNERLGYTVNARGYFGTAFVGLNTYSQGNFTRPAISQYDILAGPVYRFFMVPKYTVSGRVMGGWSHANNSGDTNGIPPVLLGLYPDGNTYAASASVIGEYNVSPRISLRLAPEYFFTGFGSTTQYSRGFTGGIAYRFGKK
jgi:hypothetical protein